jgi:hypothetical protein
MITLRRKLAQVLDNRITQIRMNDQFNEPNVDRGPAMPTAENSLERRGGDEATRQPIRSADLLRAP